MPSETKNTDKPKPGSRPNGFRASSARPMRSKTVSKSRPANPSGIQTSTPVSRNKAVTAAGPPPAAALRSAPPMKKRSKGNSFLSLIFLAAFIALGYTIWSSLLQYQSYGVIEGRVITVAAPWDGSIYNWQVRDGEEVTQGQVLAVINNIDMQHQLETLGDELTMNQALLDAEISKIQFESKQRSEQSQKTVAEYHETYGNLLSEKEKYKELDRKFKRTRKLLKTHNVSRSQYEEEFFRLAGQKKKIQQLTETVEILKYRSRQSNDGVDNGSPRLAPILAQIELSKSEIGRLRERIAQGQIKSPVNGRVSKRHRLIGESAKSGEVVIDVLEENSIQAVLYVPQSVVEDYEIGKTVEISLEPYKQKIECTVERFGDRFETAPASIERFYHINQALLPVYLTPNHETQHLLAARVGGTVKRPYEYQKGIKKLYAETREKVQEWVPQQNQSQPENVERAAVGAKANTANEPGVEVGLTDDFLGTNTFISTETSTDIAEPAETIEFELNETLQIQEDQESTDAALTIGSSF